VSDLWELVVSFGRAGLFGFGGGPAMIPLIQAEVVDLRGWLSQAEFIDAFAFGNALPGPIATKLAGYVGYGVAGWGGALLAMLAITLPTIALMVALMGVSKSPRFAPVIERMLYGVRPVVVALLAVVVWDFWPAAMTPTSLPLGGVLTLYAIVGTTLALLLRTRLHPAWLVLGGGLVGFAL
jgi:chromate transporter